MRGTIYNRNKGKKGVPANYWLSVTLGYVEDENCNRKRDRHSEGGFRTRKEAEERLAEVVSRVNGGLHVPNVKLTVAEYLDGWLASVRPSLRASTYEGYRILLEKYVVPGIGQTRLQGLTVSQLDRWYASLLENGRRDGKGGLARKSVANIHRVLRKSLSDAMRKGLLARNVAEVAEVPKVTDSGNAEMVTWTGAEMRSFLDSCKSVRLYPAFVLAATTGMRRGEILGLRWIDLDLDAARLSVRQTLLSVGSKLVWGTPKTKRSKRSIDLDAASVSILKAWKAQQAQEKLAMGGRYEDNGLVFAQADGSPLLPESFSQLFDRLVQRSGLRRLRLHDLRHTHATLALTAGVHPKIVSERLGHSTVSLTLDVYSHSVPAMDSAAAETIASLFMGG